MMDTEKKTFVLVHGARPSIKSAPGREEGPFIGRDGAEECRAVGLPAIGFAKLMADIRVGLQLVRRLLHTRPHGLGFAQGFLDLAFERAKIASHFRRKLSAALNTVGMFSSMAPALESGGLTLAPFVDVS